MWVTSNLSVPNKTVVVATAQRSTFNVQRCNVQPSPSVHKKTSIVGGAVAPVADRSGHASGGHLHRRWKRRDADHLAPQAFRAPLFIALLQPLLTSRTPPWTEVENLRRDGTTPREPPISDA
ncbi:hypothetical protein GGX14DRAFT_403892 [Mycena pura]|uniref:Uncharacterized protein n=1 Tax=Mycena pura TaxID=153505 RepID=A0AAD6UZ45_9AGAR|nr:hypothetical protein GGX14DRAFT_403892 [Mycena pura]